MTASSELKFHASEKVNDETMKLALECFKAVVKFCDGCSFKVRTALSDEECDPLKPVLENECSINFNPASANKHIVEVQHMTCVIKEQP